ncbi:Rsp5p-dependent ubiquitination, sorting of cargo proteins at the multivesicular body [Xylographa trunciseda]|nr:Rsp5p-dependent ubiquitination, sorting of cargo proteins at the multivesicular body [Xylographa trunciseda]
MAKASAFTTSYSPSFETPRILYNQVPFQGTNIVISIRNNDGSTGKGILIGMLSAFGSAGIVALIFALIYFFKYTSRGRIILDRVGRPGQYDDEQAFAKEEAEALEVMDDLQRAEYLRAKAFIQHNPPETMQTDISLSQFLAIQEKGVSAWEFEPELEIANCFVEGRTEIEFFDSACSVQSNLPIPKQNEVYYWESKIYDKPESTLISIGVTTKPYPLFRLPGWHKCSVAYTSSGHRRFNQPFNGIAYGPEYVQGDVVGVGYRPRTGTVFFTRNGKKLDDVVHAMKTQNFFPTVGANGPCTVHVNFGQSGFVFIEANVKKWGLAPMTGSLAPPPPYGSEQGSILLEAGRDGTQAPHGGYSGPGHGRSRSRYGPLGGPMSPGPVRSPTDISLAQLVHIPSHEDIGEGTSRSAVVNGATNGEQSQILNQDMEVDRHDDSAPPPEYSSPDASRRSSDGSEEERPMLRPRSPVPPVPSYDYAIAQEAAHSYEREDDRASEGQDDGAGGGPSEDDVTGLLVRSTATQWAKSSILAVDAGTHLAAIIRILEQHLPYATQTRPIEQPDSNLEQTRRLRKSRKRNGLDRGNGTREVSPYATSAAGYLGHVSGRASIGGNSPAHAQSEPPNPKLVLSTGPFRGLILPYESARANASYLLRNLISTYLITHPHLDHLSGFAVNTASFQHTSRPKKVAALPSTINAIKDHIFNDIIWPNLSDEEGGVGLVSYMRLVEGGNVALGTGDGRGYIELCDGLSVKSWSVSHGHCMKPHPHRGSSIPPMLPDQQYHSGRRDSSYTIAPPAAIDRRRSSIGDPTSRLDNACVYDSSAFFIRDEQTGREVLIFGDVEPDSISLAPRTVRVWADAAPKIVTGLLSAIFIECSYDDSQPDETLFGHLAPRHLIAELEVLAAKVTALREGAATENDDDGKERSLGDVDASLEADAAHLKRKRQSNGSSIYQDIRRGRTGFSKWRRSDAGSNSRSTSPLKGMETLSPTHLDFSPIEPIATTPAMRNNNPARFVPNGNHKATTPSPDPVRILEEEVDVKPNEPKALEGIKIVIIHVKDTLRDGPPPGEIILTQLMEWDKQAGLGCEFVLSKAGGEIWV